MNHGRLLLCIRTRHLNIAEDRCHQRHERCTGNDVTQADDGGIRLDWVVDDTRCGQLVPHCTGEHGQEGERDARCSTLYTGELVVGLATEHAQVQMILAADLHQVEVHPIPEHVVAICVDVVGHKGLRFNGPATATGHHPIVAYKVPYLLCVQAVYTDLIHIPTTNVLLAVHLIGRLSVCLTRQGSAKWKLLTGHREYSCRYPS